MELFHLVVALVLGLLAKRVRLPPMVGFLVAGFVLHGLGFENTDELQALADLGVTLLLFTIGLKLRIGTLLSPPVWAGASLHMAVTVGVGVGAVLALASAGVGPAVGLDARTAALVAFALSFSSTVLAVKVLEERGEAASLHGTVSIGILVTQDIFAVVFIALAAGTTPSPWALALLLLIPLRRLLQRLLSAVGHGELLVLTGFVLTGCAYAGFDALGVKGDLGAIFVGALLAESEKADELARTLFGFKDLLLVGFFLTIGLAGFPDGGALAVALLLLLLIPVKAAVFFVLLTRFRLRVRTALFTSATLSNFSEFGLIVGSVGVSGGLLAPDWLVVIAVALSATFAVGGPLRRLTADLYGRHGEALRRFETASRLPGDEPVDPGDARVVVLGMGRTGTAMYQRARELMGDVVLGVEARPSTVAAHVAAGRRVVRGDASDIDLWSSLAPRGTVGLVLVSVTNHELVMRTLNRMSYAHGKFAADLPRPLVAAVVEHADEMPKLRANGVDFVYDLYGEAGSGFVEDVRRALTERGIALGADASSGG